MELFELFAMGVIALIISAVCWGLLNVPLIKTLGFLCDDDRDGVKEVAAIFWQRLYLGLTLFLPMLCVLLFVPNGQHDLGKIVLYSLRWAIFGGVSLLLVLAYLVRKQIQVLQKEKLFKQTEKQQNIISEITEHKVTS